MSDVAALPLTAGPDGADSIIHEGEGGARVMRTVFPSGVRVLTEHMPTMRSATVGFWLGVGSRDEAPGHEGSTHFLEHLLFKGTGRRSALEIAEVFDSVGGESNAATAKESTCYYARVLSRDLPQAVDVIADMVTGARIDPDDLEQERDVILEELAMDADDLTEVAHERFAQAVLGTHPLGLPIGGTPEAIRAVPREAVVAHYRAHYRPQDLVITAAGGLDHEKFCALVRERLEAAGWDLESPAEPVSRRASDPADIRPTTGLTAVPRDSEQTHVILGAPGIHATDERRYTLSVLNAILGGGMSSRLFQEVREKRGMAYAVYSFASSFSDTGYFGVYAGCSPHRTADVIRVIRAVLRDFAEHGVTEEEIIRARGQIAGASVMALEDPGARMTRLGRSELVTGEFVDADEALRRIDAVTREDVQELARVLIDTAPTAVVVGRIDDHAVLASALEGPLT
ncbi:M16 family metallopeptidase [Arthrobacter sp. UM1]|uniref:M16 family metallopeptidase n=1 Tax=Arthrobacter sp. UM1 TaxID=2766776 RepID=UPI0039AF0521